MNQQQVETALRIANAEIATLRRKLGENGRYGRRLDAAYTDALLLAGFHVAYLPTTRAFAYTHAGITHCRWENAIALLRFARIINQRVWRAHDLVTIEAGLAKAKAKAAELPEAFRARLPRHARPACER